MNMRASGSHHRKLRYSSMALNCFLAETHFYMWRTLFTVSTTGFGAIEEMYLWVCMRRCFQKNLLRGGRPTSYVRDTDWIKIEEWKKASSTPKLTSLRLLTEVAVWQSCRLALLPPCPSQCDGLCALRPRVKRNHSFLKWPLQVLARK